jgi:hypothetical protein
VILSEILLWRSFLAKDNPKTIDDVAGWAGTAPHAHCEGAPILVSREQDHFWCHMTILLFMEAERWEYFRGTIRPFCNSRDFGAYSIKIQLSSRDTACNTMPTTSAFSQFTDLFEFNLQREIWSQSSISSVRDNHLMWLNQINIRYRPTPL